MIQDNEDASAEFTTGALGRTPEATGENAVPPDLPDLHLMRALGRGGFGEVWLGRNLVGVHVAIKIVPKQEKSAVEIEGIRQYQLHARHHPHLVVVLHIGQTHECYYYVLELADSVTQIPIGSAEEYEPRTLRSELKRRGRLPVDECLTTTRSLLSGLSHLHAHGLLHRDVKPDNVIWVDGQVKLADVGLVTKSSRPLHNAQSPRYSPPGGIRDASGDLHGVGCVLLEMLLGGLPVRGEEPPPGRANDEPLRATLVRVAREAMCGDGGVGFRTAEEMLRALEAATSTGSGASEARATRNRVPNRTLGRVWRILAMAGAAGGAALLAVMLLHGDSGLRDLLSDSVRQESRGDEQEDPSPKGSASRGSDATATETAGRGTQSIPDAQADESVQPKSDGAPSPAKSATNDRFEADLKVQVQAGPGEVFKTMGRGVWSVRTGDRVRLGFALAKERYAYLVWVDASGAPVLVNETEAQTPVREFSAPADTMAYPITDPSGTEVVLLVASDHQLDIPALLDRIRALSRPPRLEGDVVMNLDDGIVDVFTPPSRRGLDLQRPVKTSVDAAQQYLERIRESFASEDGSIRGVAFPHR